MTTHVFTPFYDNHAYAHVPFMLITTQGLCITTFFLCLPLFYVSGTTTGEPDLQQKQ